MLGVVNALRCASTRPSAGPAGIDDAFFYEGEDVKAVHVQFVETHEAAGAVLHKPKDRGGGVTDVEQLLGDRRSP